MKEASEEEKAGGERMNGEEEERGGRGVLSQCVIARSNATWQSRKCFDPHFPGLLHCVRNDALPFNRRPVVKPRGPGVSGPQMFSR